MKYLVTGGAGFIGSHIVERLINDGHEVHVLDDESAPENVSFHKIEGVNYEKIDINDEKTEQFYKGVDVVFHHAARSRIQPSYGNPRHTYENNVLGTQRVLDSAIKAGVRRVIYAGSSSCYGLSNPAPMKEDMNPDCLNHYALSKLQGEQLGKIYSRIYDLEFLVLRYFNVYGPREPLKGTYAPVIGIFKNQKKLNTPLTIVGDGEQRRDFTHVYDVVEANMLAAFTDSKIIFSNNEKFDVFNIGSGKNYSVNQIADLVGGPRVHIENRSGEARLTLADNSKVRKKLGWTPTRDVAIDIFNY